MSFGEPGEGRYRLPSDQLDPGPGPSAVGMLEPPNRNTARGGPPRAQEQVDDRGSVVSGRPDPRTSCGNTCLLPQLDMKAGYFRNRTARDQAIDRTFSTSGGIGDSGAWRDSPLPPSQAGAGRPKATWLSPLVTKGPVVTRTEWPG